MAVKIPIRIDESRLSRTCKALRRAVVPGLFENVVLKVPVQAVETAEYFEALERCFEALLFPSTVMGYTRKLSLLEKKPLLLKQNFESLLEKFGDDDRMGDGWPPSGLHHTFDDDVDPSRPFGGRICGANVSEAVNAVVSRLLLRTWKGKLAYFE